MLTNKKITVLFIIFLTVIFLLPEATFAQATDVFGVNDLAESGVNLGTRDLKEIIAGIVNIFLGFLGILATLTVLYGGFIWMTSNGNSEKIDKAKRLLINGAIGLIIILSSYAIARFILRAGYDGVFGTGSDDSGGGYFGGAGLGAGALENHYPARNAKNVPRNTNIYLTFKEPMDVSQIVADEACGGVNCEANPGFINLWEQGNPTPITENDLIINYIPESGTGYVTTFQLNPYGTTNNNLGSNTSDVNYRMELGDLTTLNNSPAFPYSNAYNWIFTTGTEFDFTPPRITSVVPVGDGHPRNSAVQINFSEAVNPILSTGNTATGFVNIRVLNNDAAGGPALVVGEYRISNQYRTVELITDNLCGLNSCGGEVFCLPASDNTSPENFAATVDGTGTILAANAVADMADNILDGDNDNTAGGDYNWAFGTTNEIDLVPPTVSQMQDASDISLINSIEVQFDKPLLSSSINSTNIDIVGAAGAINYWLSLNADDGSNQDLNSRTVSINHEKFDPSSIYTPRLTSGIKDLRQNCWYPCDCNAADNSCVCNNPPCAGPNCSGTDL